MLIYNKLTGYNKARYNAEGTEIQKADSLSVSDSTVTKDSRKTNTELIILSDSTAKQQNKSVTETIRLNDWTRINKDQASPWSD